MVTVQTVSANVGDVDATIRLNGTIAAKNQRTILAPRIQGSRTDVNRGGSANMLTTGRRSRWAAAAAARRVSARRR